MTSPSGLAVFDADNHFYETTEALTRHLPDRYRHAIQYVKLENGRTKLAVGGRISEYIPNPTFDVVAPPGAQEEYYRRGNPEGKSRRELFGEPIRSPQSFREPESRLELMDRQGVDRALMFPHPGQRDRGAHEGRPGLSPCRRPRPQRMDARDLAVRLRGPHLRHAGHHPSHRGESHRRARVGGRTRRQGGADPPGAGPRAAGHPLVRARRVRPLLGEGHRLRRSRRHALLGLRLRPDHQLVDGQRQRDAPLQAGRLQDAPGVAAHRGLGGVADRPRRSHPPSEAQDRGDRERRLVGGAAAAGTARHLQEDAARLPGGPDPGDAALHPHQPLLGGELRRPRRPARRRQRALRLGLPAPPRGWPTRPTSARRSASRSASSGRASSWATTWPA